MQAKSIDGGRSTLRHISSCSDFWPSGAATELAWATVGRPRGNARNATKTNVVAISSLKHLNGVMLGNVKAWVDQEGAL